jgi:hypothetical protein
VPDQNEKVAPPPVPFKSVKVSDLDELKAHMAKTLNSFVWVGGDTLKKDMARLSELVNAL